MGIFLNIILDFLDYPDFPSFQKPENPEKPSFLIRFSPRPLHVASRLLCFFRKKFSRAESCAEEFLVCVVRRDFRHTTSAYNFLS